MSYLTKQLTLKTRLVYAKTKKDKTAEKDALDCKVSCHHSSQLIVKQRCIPNTFDTTNLSHKQHIIVR